LNTTYKIIPEGKYKGKRLYDELKHDGSDILPSEIEAFFKNALDNNYKIFVFNCISNHSIKIPQNDLDFFKKILDYNEGEKVYEAYKFSNEVLKIKELQYFDIKQLYGIAIKSDKIGALFINPFLENNNYCFNICLVVTSDFNINDILNLNFNLIKINSVNKYINVNNLVSGFFQNLYDLNNTQFKDYIVTWKELNQTRPYDRLELPERIEYNDYCDLYLKLVRNNPDLSFEDMKKKLDSLEKKWSDKEIELWDIELYKNFHFRKLCMHFYFFHEILLNDCVFYTNFFQITNVVKADIDEDNSLKIDYDELQPYSLECLFVNDPYMLFSITLPVYQWKKK
jgi:hypothetical protein